MIRYKVFVGYSTINAKTPHDVRCYDKDIIKKDLLNHFLTKKGERVMYPDFGSIVWDLLFEPMDEINKNLIVQDSIRIIENDSRVSFKSMTIDEVSNGLVLKIYLEYRYTNDVDYLYVTYKKSTQYENNSFADS